MSNLRAHLVLLNGILLGIHMRPAELLHNFRQLRRGGRVSAYASVFVNAQQRCVYIVADGGRVCRPYVIVLQRQPHLQAAQHIEELARGLRTFDDCVHDGLVEFLDVNEENDCLIAVTEADIVPATTHLEIEPCTLLGARAGLVPHPNHNQAARTTFQCAMGKHGPSAPSHATSPSGLTRCCTIMRVRHFFRQQSRHPALGTLPALRSSVLEPPSGVFLYTDPPLP